MKNTVYGISWGKALTTLCLGLTLMSAHAPKMNNTGHGYCLEEVVEEPECFTAIQVQEVMNVVYIRDVSGSAEMVEFDSKKTLKKVLSMLDLKESKAKVNLYTSTIGSHGIPVVNVATLPGVEGRFASAGDRNNDLYSFVKKSLADFAQLDQPTHGSTEIFRTLVAVTDLLEPGADRTILIISSDFISSGAVTSFLKYNPPEELMKDFEEIMDKFKKDNGGKLPNLTGAEVIMVSFAGSNQLAIWSTNFWEDAFYYMGTSNVVKKAAL
ncbi:MAG: hypothetical protein JXR03_18465 [Cyclobacteriaceae bacterium]